MTATNTDLVLTDFEKYDAIDALQKRVHELREVGSRRLDAGDHDSARMYASKANRLEAIAEKINASVGAS